MKNLKPIEYGGQKVLLSRQVAEVFGITHTKVKKTFQSHRAKFVAGEHFYLLEGAELEEFRTEHLQEFKRMRMAQMIYLWTAAGVALLSERFVDGKKIYAELAREYFNAPEVEVETDPVKSLVPVVFANQRVLLSKQLAQVYECSEDVIKKNFSNNREQYVEGVHYFVLAGAALEDLRVKNIHLQISPLARVLYLWTYRGCVRHCKSINTAAAWAQFDKLEEFYFSAKKEEPKKERKPRSEYASVYGMKMSNNLVKIGHSDDVEGRIPEVERESGWQVKDEYHTPKMERPRAIKEEFRLHKKYSHVKVHGEYFNAPFDDVKGDIDEITLTLEEEIVIGVSDNDKKLLVEMLHTLNDSPFKEQLAKETANLLFGEKIF